MGLFFFKLIKVINLKYLFKCQHLQYKKLTSLLL